MKYAGKITIGLICLILALGITWTITQKVQAQNWGTQTISIHKSMGSGFGSVTNAYAIISPVTNCDMYDSTGAVQTTYASAAITFTADTEYTAEALGTIPGLPKTISDWEITFYENASPAATDSAVVGPLRLDPTSGRMYSDTNPVGNNRVRTN